MKKLKSLLANGSNLALKFDVRDTKMQNKMNGQCGGGEKWKAI